MKSPRRLYVTTPYAVRTLATSQDAKSVEWTMLVPLTKATFTE
jgi:hypothetical protein